MTNGAWHGHSLRYSLLETKCALLLQESSLRGKLSPAFQFLLFLLCESFCVPSCLSTSISFLNLSFAISDYKEPRKEDFLPGTVKAFDKVKSTARKKATINIINFQNGFDVMKLDTRKTKSVCGLHDMYGPEIEGKFRSIGSQGV